MQHAMCMAVSRPRNQLTQKLFYNQRSHTQIGECWAGALGQRLTPPTLRDGQGFHVFLEVEVEVLEDKIELVAVGVDNVEEAHDVRVVHFLEQGDLADGGGGHAFVFGFEPDLFERDDAAVFGGKVFGFVDDAVGA